MNNKRMIKDEIKDDFLDTLMDFENDSVEY